MYRSASRYESSRAIPDKLSRSTRSNWVEPQQNRSYATALEDDDRGILRDPYLAEDAHVLDARDYQHKDTSSSGGTDLREAQRLAANFFSQYPSASTAPEPVYRDAARITRPLSPEVPIVDRYPPRGSQYRDRDIGVDRWSSRPNPEPLFPSSFRSQLVLEDWEEERVPVDNRRERDLYGVAAARGRKTKDVAWDDNDYDYGVGGKEADYPPIQTAADLDGGGLRVTKRLDWTGLLRPDGNRAAPVEDGLDMNLRLNKQRTFSQIYRGGGGRPYVESDRGDGLEDELNPEGSRCGGGYYGTEQRYRELDVRKEQSRGGYIDEPRRPVRNEYMLGRSLGIGSRGAGERGGRGGREGWKMNRETSAGQGQERVFDSERGRDKRRFEDRDSRLPFFSSSSSRHSDGGGGSGADRGRDFPDDGSLHFGKGRGGGRYGAPKRDFSQRASITNQDILAVYYGNQGPGRQPSKFATPTRGYPYPTGPSRQNTPPRRPRRSSRSPPPFRGRPGRQNLDLDPSRKGKKRWEKPAVEGSEGKRFKRETQSDKLYLMHNSKAKSEEKEQEAASTLSAVAEREAQETREGEAKAVAVEPAMEDTQNPTNAAVQGSNPPEPTNGLWGGTDNDDSWSDSEEEKQAQMTWDGPSTNDPSGRVEPPGEERELATLQALQSAAVNDSKNFLGECSEGDEDDDADWESLASDLYDELDDVCVHQGAETEDIISENPDSQKGVVTPTNPEAQASEKNGSFGILSVAQSQDSEMVDIDNIERSEEGKEEVAEVDSSVKEGSVVIEKKKVGMIMEELQESVKNREDKAFDYYVPLFEQDTDLMKLYEANVNCGSFECLVCAGVGAKKKKRFPDVASLVQHAKKILRTKKLPEHRGFARAVCKILGWETVPGPSVILPRGCIPAQQSEPSALPVPAPVKHFSVQAEAGDGGNAVELEREWAAARQLFEEQEARIDLTTKSSGALLQTDKTAISWHPSSSDGKNSDTPLGLDDLETVVETTTVSEKTTTADVNSMPEKASLKVASDPAQAFVVKAVSIVEIAADEDLSVLEKSEVAKAIPASELLTVPDNSTVPRPSLMYEIVTVVPAEEGLLRSSCEVEMWAPLPREVIVEDHPTQLPVVEAKGVNGSAGQIAPADVGTAPPLPVKATLANGVDLLVGESPGGRMDENCTSVEVAKRSPV